jgi:hypothetical protein
MTFVLEEPGAKTRPWWRTRPFLIMVVAGLFHLGRGATVDGVVFLGTATALAAAELRAPPGPGPRREPRRREIPSAAVLVAIPAGWLVATWRPGTVPVAVAVALTGPPMLYLALAKGGRTEPASTGIWWPWATIGVAICLWELTAFLHQSDAQTENPDHPTISAIVDPITGDGLWRAVMIICWLAAGIFLVRLMLTRSRPCTT